MGIQSIKQFKLSLKDLKGIRVPLSPSSNTLKGVQALLLGLLTSFGKARSRRFSIPTALVLTILSAVFGFSFFSHSAYAASYINVSSGSGGTVSLGSIKPSSSGVSTSGSDTLTIHTDCSTGYSVYVSGQKDKDTNLTNSSASSNNTIATSSTTVGSTATALSLNTWGLNSENTGAYVGLPTYDNATNKALTSKSSVSESSTVPIYYGVKVDTSLTPGTYTGNVLYTVLMDSSCLAYTVVFNSNGGTGTMNNQSIMAGTATSLTANSFTRDGYAFLGWSTKETGKTGTASNGIGTSADVDYTNEQSVTDLTSGGSSITLYAIWQKVDGTMQSFSCASLASGATANLQDTRDGQVYSVYRIPTDQTYAGTSTIANVAGKCIMTQDLSLGYVSGNSTTKDSNLTLTAADSNFDTNASNSSYETVSYDTTETVKFVDSADGGTGWSDINSYTNKQYTNGPHSGYETYSSHAYYSWGAALVVCPKGWRLPTSVEYADNGPGNTPATGIAKIVGNSSAGSSNLQKSPWSFVLGGVFLSSGWDNHSQYPAGHYWSSTQSNATFGLSLLFNSYYVYRDYNFKYYGYSVRCISDPATMQDFDSTSSLPNAGDSTYLVDSRDGKTYAVKRLPDGKVWMMQNLTVNGVALTPDNTNIDNGTTYYLPKDGGIGSITSSSTVNSTSGYNFNGANSNQASFKLRTKDHSITNDSDTGYYNFYTATLGFASFRDGVSSGSSTKDICPKGWRLPRTTDNGATVDTIGSANDFTNLVRTYSTNNWDGTPTSYEYLTTNVTAISSMHLSAAFPSAATDQNNYAGFSYSGAWANTESSAVNVGSAGDYLSSSVESSGATYRLMFSSSAVGPQYSLVNYEGGAVRCIAQTSYTVNYSSDGATSGSPSKTTETLNDGANLTLPTAGTMVKSGFEFKGWAFTSGATEAAYSASDTIRVSALAAAAKTSGQTISPGSTITLYPVWKELPIAMQDFNCYDLAAGTSTTLRDARDNQEYTVYRFPTDVKYAGTSTVANVAGKCLMTKDLNLGAVNSVSGASSSITANGTMTLSPNDSGFTTPTGSGESITVPTSNVTISNTYSSTNSYSNKYYKADGTGDYAGRGYYSWGAAMVACPKGWRLPTSEEYNNSGSWESSTTGISAIVKGDNRTATIANITSSPYSFVLGGFYDGGLKSATVNGFYWSATQYSSGGAHDLYMYTSGLRQGSEFMSNGASVRCITDPVEPCSDTVHPTATTGCKMKDNNTWIYGNNGVATTWTDIASKCPTGYTLPTADIFETLISAQGASGELYTALGLSSTRSFWSSSYKSSESVVRDLTVSNNSATITMQTPTGSEYWICYKSS